MRIAVYPGSFDPITYGHLDIIERASGLFDVVIVTVFENASKTHQFPQTDRLAMIRESTGHLSNVRVEAFEGLLVDFARARGAKVIVKGLRAVSDFDYEFKMALMNKKLAPELETVFMMTSSRYLYISSSLIKELFAYGACIDGLVPPAVLARLQQ
ncbi:MAG: pantetheine-phosphate adenylyltransferase [Bacillota bacterium]